MRLEMYMGGMFGGKTSRALEQAARLEAIGHRVLYVSPTIDDRAAGLWTHGGEERTQGCVKMDSLDEITPEATEGYRAVLIDEIQFFDKVGDFLRRAEWQMPRLLFIVTCLSGDFERKPWPSVCELIPMADAIHHMTAYCSKCSEPTPAPFSHRKVLAEGKVVIGGADSYEALCRHHYLE